MDRNDLKEVEDRNTVEDRNIDAQIRSLELMLKYGNEEKKAYALAQIERLSNMLPVQSFEDYTRN